MKTTKGIFLDTVLNDTPPNYLAFGKNLLLTEKLGVIQNEPGFTLAPASVPYPIIGILPVFNRFIIWSTNDSFSEIGISTEGGSYTKILNDTDIGVALNFKQAAPIKAEFYKSAQGEIIVAWIDDINTPKIINIDNPSFQANDLELFPAASLTTPSVFVNQTGGALPSGVYRVLYQYEDDDGSTSNYSAISKPASIIKAASTDAANLVWGSAAGESTGKAIQFVIGNLDINWSFVNIVVIKTVNNVTTIEQVAKIATSIANSFFGSYVLSGFYTGTEQITTLTLNEILTPKAFYKTAKAITQLNNKLYLGNLTVDDEVQIQKFACNVKIQWRSILIGLLGTTAQYKEASGTDHSTFAHGEVYAFYLQVRDKKTGLWSKGYHIPGRAFIPGDDTIISPNPSSPSNVSGTGSPSFKKYQLEDTVTYLGIDLTNLHRVGTMGYWSNTVERYPNDDQYNGSVDYNGTPIPGGRDLRGQFVLHHKFPSLGFLKSNVYQTTTSYGRTELDILKIDVSNVLIPISLASRISAWRIAYARRDIGNATVLGVSPIFFYSRGETTGQLKPVVTNGSVNQASGGDDLFMDIDTSVKAEGSEFIRFHAFNLLIDKPSIAPTYLRQEIGLNYISSTNPAITNDPRLITDAPGNPLVARKWVLYNNSTLASTTGPAVTDRFRNVSFIQYLPTGAIISSSSKTINHVAGEDCILLRNNITNISSNSHKFLNRISAANPFLYQHNAKHNTYLSSLCTLKSDVYNSFISQNLITTDSTANVISTSALIAIGGGDNWVGSHSIHLQGPAADNAVVGTEGGNLEGHGCKGVHYVITEAPKNLNYRYQDPANPQSNFYDATNLFPKIVSSAYATRYLGLMDLFKSPVYLYNNDYTTRSQVEIGVNLIPFDSQVKIETQFPTTIATSITQGNESAKVNWKTFLVSDRYTMPRNRGNLINLQGVGNQRLYIHHENSLFITKDRTTLKGDIASVTLGSGNIFEVTPFEVLSTDQGYGGTQHKFACVLTKIGYIFPDASQGKWFIHNGEQLEEISKNGLRQFWRDNLSTNLLDNPFANNGITTVYDERFNRVIVSVGQDPINYITASYSPQLEAWCSLHDYSPSYMFSLTKNKLFSVKTLAGSSNFYLHNTGNYGVYYQIDGSTFPLIVDVVYNNNPYETKYFTSINWVTEVYTTVNTILSNETINYLTVRSNSKTTGRVAIVQYSDLADVYAANTRLTERSWSFNQLRNVAQTPLVTAFTQDIFNNFNLNTVNLNLDKDWYDQGRIVDNFVVVRFEYSNLNNNKFLLLDHDVEERKSYRG